MDRVNPVAILVHGGLEVAGQAIAMLPPPLRPRLGDGAGCLHPGEMRGTTLSRRSVGNEARAGLGSVPGSCNTAGSGSVEPGGAGHSSDSAE